MKGSHSIIVEDKKLRYEFTIKRNITVIRGDSATGKTTLIEMIAGYQRAGSSSGVSISCDCPLVVAYEDDWSYRIKANPGSIIFVDEDNHFTATKEFAETVKQSDNYFVLVTRNNLSSLPYSVTEIYGIRTSSHYAGLRQVYHELYPLYGNQLKITAKSNTCILVEDSNSGYDFFTNVFSVKQIKVLSAAGKSNVLGFLLRLNEPCVVIADGAAFGPEIDRIMSLIMTGRKIMLYLPESFEWMILSSGIIFDPEIKDMLKHPEDYIESEKFFSWERYFTSLLAEKTEGTYLSYRKSTLNPSYLSDAIKNKIIDVMPNDIKK